MCSTRGHWLPGDPRGFRDHDHRIHSTGDYKRPPPPGQHAGLYRYARQHSQKTVYLTIDQRAVAGESIVSKFDLMGFPVRVIAVGATHVHAAVRLANIDAKPIFGRAKQFASHQLRKELPGTIWGEGCHPVRIKSEEHYREVVVYILDHAKEGAWTWEHPRVAARSTRGFEDSAPAS